MFKHLRTTVFSVFLLTFFISCQKDIDSSAGLSSGTAVFALDGAPSGCASTTVSGVYATGAALSTGNTVTLTVDVQVKGTYAFRTNSANGIYFAAAGSFSSTGSQTVVLTGVGTPVSVGNYTYATTNKNACNFNVAFTTGTGGGGGTTAVFSYAGAPGNCTGATPSGTYFNGVALGASNFVDLTVNVTTAGAYNITTNSSKGISFIGTGVFTTTGTTTVRLTGQGTPNATGAAILTPTGGCSFSITIGTAPSAGVFTYNCTIPPIVAGTYTAGTALNATNTIVIAVNVTTAGSYSVTTGSANGVSFSGSGVFAATGPNVITLSSTSNPNAVGLFSYTPSGAGGCAFNITYGTGGGGDFLKCTIDGVVINFNTGLTGTLVPNAFNVDGDFGTTSNLSVDAIDLFGTVTTGTYNKFTLTNFARFGDLTYTPNLALPLETWSTTPANSNLFSVTIQTISATAPIIVTGIFSGDIFDVNDANKKVVTNGSFRITL